MHRLEKIAITVMVIVLVVLLCFFTFAMPSFQKEIETAQPIHLPYEKYFNPENITRVDIIIDDELFQKMLDEVPEEPVLCTIALNGDKYQNVGIKIKGHLSKQSVKNSSTSERFGFKIEAATFVKQVIGGLDSFVLNPELFDATMMREFLSYEMLREAGVKTPLFTYAAVYVNGEYWGLYLMAESVDKSFLIRNYGVLDGNLYRPEGTTFLVAPNNTIGPDPSKIHYGGHLEYIDDDWRSYDEIFSHPVYLSHPSEGINTIMKIVQGLHNHDADVIDLLNIDEILAYFAVNAAISNYDSYFSQLETHNYFFYEQDGILTIFPWDYDLVLGPPFISSSNAVNMPIDEPVRAIWGNYSLNRLALMEYIVSTPELKEKYHQTIRSVALNQMGEHLIQRIDEISKRIYPYVMKDPHASYPVENYDKAVSALKKFVELRTQNLLDQVDGKIPTTNAEQNAHPETLTDVSDFNVTDMESVDIWKQLWP